MGAIMEAFIFLGAIILLVIWYCIANEFYNIAVMKGYNEKRYLWWSFFFSIAGWLMVVALPNKQNAGTKPQAEAKAPVAAVDELPEL